MATPVPILVFLGLSVLHLGPMYATDRQTSDSIIIPPSVRAQGQGIMKAERVREREREREMYYS